MCDTNNYDADKATPVRKHLRNTSSLSLSLSLSIGGKITDNRGIEIVTIRVDPVETIVVAWVLGE